MPLCVVFPSWFPGQNLTLSPPALTPSESGSSAADSGWMISAMGFCPELARPLGAPALIVLASGRTWLGRGFGWDGGPLLRGSLGGRWAVFSPPFWFSSLPHPSVGQRPSAIWSQAVS